MRLTIFATTLAAVALASPVPQTLTEEQFRGFPDEENNNNGGDKGVFISSGYSRVARYGRGFDNAPLKPGTFFHSTLRVKSPSDLSPLGDHRGRNRDDLNEVRPVFDLQKMLEQQELKRRIAEADRLEFQRQQLNEVEEEEEKEVTSTTETAAETTTTTFQQPEEETTTLEASTEKVFEYEEDEFDGKRNNRLIELFLKRYKQFF